MKELSTMLRHLKAAIMLINYIFLQSMTNGRIMKLPAVEMYFIDMKTLKTAKDQVGFVC